MITGPHTAERAGCAGASRRRRARSSSTSRASVCAARTSSSTRARCRTSTTGGRGTRCASGTSGAASSAAVGDGVDYELDRQARHRRHDARLRTCDRCLAGRHHVCELPGGDRHQPGPAGALAEKVAVPAVALCGSCPTTSTTRWARWSSPAATHSVRQRPRTSTRGAAARDGRGHDRPAHGDVRASGRRRGPHPGPLGPFARVRAIPRLPQRLERATTLPDLPWDAVDRRVQQRRAAGASHVDARRAVAKRSCSSGSRRRRATSTLARSRLRT